MPMIYIVEDDDNIREMLLYALSSAGFEVLGFPEGQSFLQTMRQSSPALALLDIMLPGEDGMELLRKIRQSSQLPVIMLTAKGAEIDRVRGLDSGADDYITKPFSIMEVISRIRAVLRRYESAPAMELCVEGIVLNAEKRTVHAEGQEIALTFKEFELLQYLMTNPGLVLTRDKLLDQVWGFDYNGESRTIDMHIKSLRQKLGTQGEAIKTVRNVGYKIGV